MHKARRWNNSSRVDFLVSLGSSYLLLYGMTITTRAFARLVVEPRDIEVNGEG